MKRLIKQYYSRSQTNVNAVYCNYKEIASSYSEITDRNLPQSMPNVAIIFKIFIWTLRKHVIFKIVTIK